MIFTTGQLIDKLKGYSNPFGKLGRMVRRGEVYPLTRGVYEDNPIVSGLFLAGAIYGPSYISFDTALAYHGLIPEAVYNFTSATCEKGKKKSYTNHFGLFTYHDVPLKVFPCCVNLLEQDGYVCLMASPEKALCDKLYEKPLCMTQKGLEQMLFEDMRIDSSYFEELNREDIYRIVPKYHSSNLNLLGKYLRRKHHE